jgi:hypothetical protein
VIHKPVTNASYSVTLLEAWVKGFDPLSYRSVRLCVVVASSYTITMFAPPTLDDVVTGISRFTVVDDAFTDRDRLVPLGVLRMN